MEKVMIDTSAIYALLDRSDENHEKAKQRLQNLARENAEVLMTNFLVAETHALLLGRLGHQVARLWLKNLAWTIEPVQPKDEERAQQIIFTYTDKSFSYADATTFAVMERLAITSALAFDNHFSQYGFQNS